MKSIRQVVLAGFVLAFVIGSVTAGAEPFTFVQMCDPQLGMGGYEHDVEAFKEAVDQINALEPDFVLICGDLVNETNDDHAFADFNAIKKGFTIPCYCAPGNHDVGNQPTEQSLERYRKLIGQDYYAFDHKGYTFVIANTQLWKAPLAIESEKHDTWFKDTLKAAHERGNPIIVAQHYPLFVAQPDEKDEYFNLSPEKRGELLRVFEACGVIAVLSGHTHKTILNEYKGIQMVCSATTSKNFDGKPFGFRLWHVDEGSSPQHEFITLEQAAVSATD